MSRNKSSPRAGIFDTASRPPEPVDDRQSLLYAMAGTVEKRVGPFTGAAEYLVAWADSEECTWVPAAQTNALAEGMLGARDIASNAELAGQHPDGIVPLTALNARRLLPPAAPKKCPTITPSLPSPITPNAIFHQLLSSVTANQRAAAEPLAATPLTSRLLSAASAPQGTVVPLVPARQPRRSGREGAKEIAKGRVRISALGRLPKHTAALFGQAASHAAVRVGSPVATASGGALDDDCVVVTCLRRVAAEPPRKNHRADNQPSHARGGHSAANEGGGGGGGGGGDDGDDDADDDGAAAMCRQPYLVDFAILPDAASADEAGDDGKLPDPSGVQLTMPLTQFRHQYPQPLIRFLFAHARVLPLPPVVERALDGAR